MYFIIYRSDNPKGKFVVFTSATHAVYFDSKEQARAYLAELKK